MPKSLLKSTGTVAGMTLFSRVLGFVRDIVIAYIFGTSLGADAFFVANKIPNFMRRLFAEGAFSQAFVPLLSEYRQQKTPAQVMLFLDHVLGTLMSVLCVVTILGILLAPAFIVLFAPGFLQDPARFQLATHLLRLVFPYIFFISLTACAGAILNTYSYFAVPAFTPVLLNISLISAALFLTPHLDPPILSLALGVLIAGIVQCLFQFPFLKAKKLLPRPRLGFSDSGVRRLLKQMVPALFGVSVAQINIVIDTLFASFLQVGSVSWLYYSDRLMSFPLGVFGVGIATVVLPHLSDKHASQDAMEFSKTLGWALRFLLLIGMPAVIGLFCLAGPLLATLFQYGRFRAHDVFMARESLMAFALGVQFFMLVKVLAAGFYAKHDIKTPVKVAAVAMLTNIILNIVLIGPLAHAGIALATSLSGLVNTGLLFYFLRRNKIFVADANWLIFVVRLIIANGVLAVWLFVVTKPLSVWLTHAWSWRAYHLGLIVLMGVVVYFASLLLLGLRPKDMQL